MWTHVLLHNTCMQALLDIDSHSCKKKQHEHNCITCRKYYWPDNKPRKEEEFKHEAIDRDCPAAKLESEKEMNEINNLLREASL